MVTVEGLQNPAKDKHFNHVSFVPAVALDTLVENCHKLLEKFHYSWEMMPLIFVILNYAGSDLDEASRKIDEGKLPRISFSRLSNFHLYLLCNKRQRDILECYEAVAISVHN